ncbi:MAG: GNAT family N-acetyltransferase [Casimicrobiaceae bacterium]
MPDYYPIVFALKDADGEVLGGLLGDIWGGWLHIGFLWVARPLRGKNWATKLMRAAERYAVERGAHDATLETFSFQARGFYEQLGYEVFGTLDDFPPGHAKYFLRRHLARRKNQPPGRKDPELTQMNTDPRPSPRPRMNTDLPLHSEFVQPRFTAPPIRIFFFF